MYNLTLHTASSSPTWQNSRSCSEIDFIWAYYTILTYLISFNIDDTDNSSLSDHKILTARWSFPHILHGQLGFLGSVQFRFRFNEPEPEPEPQILQIIEPEPELNFEFMNLNWTWT